MTVEWRDKRWPGFVHMLLRLLRVKAADQAALHIHLEEPAALGRMILEDREGAVLYALIDSSRTRDKWFYLPADTAEAGMALKNEAGETLFRLWVEGRNAVQPIQPMTETEPPSSNAETNGSVAASPPPEDTASTPSTSPRAEAAQKPPAQTDTIDGNTRRESPNAPIDTQTAEHQAPQPDEAPGMEKRKGRES